ARYANALALMLAVRQSRKLAVGQAQARVVAAHVELQRISGLLTSWDDVLQEPGGLPRPHTAAQLFGKTLRVGRSDEGLARQDGRGGVVTVIGCVLVEARYDHIGLKRADSPHHSGQCRDMSPYRQRFIGTFGVAEVAQAGKALQATIDASGRQ